MIRIGICIQIDIRVEMKFYFFLYVPTKSETKVQKCKTLKIFHPSSMPFSDETKPECTRNRG